MFITIDLSKVFGPGAAAVDISLDTAPTPPALVARVGGQVVATMPLSLLGPAFPTTTDLVAAFVPGQLVELPAPVGPPCLAILAAPPPVDGSAVTVLAQAQLPAPKADDAPPAPTPGRMLRAKFDCVAVTKYAGGSEQAQMQAALGAGNEAWSQFTPSGSLTIAITNPAATGKLTPGKSYFLDFTEAQ